MTDIINNPWVTGIGGGIISSIIVFFITRYIFSKKEKKEYLQKIETANNEILHSIRPLIVEKEIPDNELVNSVRHSIAKKYGVKSEDLYSDLSLSNDFICKIMSNSFLSSQQKLEFCTNIKKLKEKPKTLSDKNVEYVYLNRKSSLSQINSVMLASMTGVMVMMTTFLVAYKDSGLDNVLKDKITLISTAIIFPIVSIAIVSVFKLIKEKDLLYNVKHAKIKNIKEEIKNDREIDNNVC